MPLVHIPLNAWKPESHRRDIVDAVHRAMVETIKVPEKDKFQILSEEPAGSLVYDPSYLDIARTHAVVFIQITLNAGRTVEMKEAFHARAVELLVQSPGLRK